MAKKKLNENELLEKARKHFALHVRAENMNLTDLNESAKYAYMTIEAAEKNNNPAIKKEAEELIEAIAAVLDIVGFDDEGDEDGLLDTEVEHYD
jgi:hypothetical protein